MVEVCEGLEETEPIRLFENVIKDAHDGITESEILDLFILTARALIEEEPQYRFVAARLLLVQLRKEALSFLGVEDEQNFNSLSLTQLTDIYCQALPLTIQRGIDLGFLNPELGNFDLDRLARAIQPERDGQFAYLGIQTLYDRYFIHHNETRFEMPQVFFMRVAMGLALNEPNREERAIEFYRLLSSFLFMSSTPTLFNSGTVRSQLSSCYISTVPDDLDGIYGSIKDNALLSKWAGGLGNDWTRVRAHGAYIRGTNGKSQGVVPFLKVVNDTALAVNQGGKRKGAVCSYLETWHLDIEEFISLRKNTGDARRRTPDMHMANWIPDLFMERVTNDESWTLFSPHDVPELHETHGAKFRELYEAAEAKTHTGEIEQFKQVSALDLWKSMLGTLYETGHPWMTFKDSCNIRSPQQHAGVIHSSNLCTEITLNTSDDEIAVCNLGSVNLQKHLNEDGSIDKETLRATVRTAIRMLDNVIDINYYAVPAARNSNEKHRPIGLGLMGFQDALFAKRIPYGGKECVEFADESMEFISYFAIEASSDLATERGRYSSFDGSLWDQGILPIDSLEMLANQRSSPEFAEFDRTIRLDWQELRDKVQLQGMRNSNVMAIAPTATIANIVGVTPSIEPLHQNLFVKSNLSGEFTVINHQLVNDLKRLNMWDKVTLVDLKANNGSLQKISRVPDHLKELYRTSFEIDQHWIIDAAARRQKWIDQSQSLNLYFSETSGPKLDRMYRHAWRSGLKTTYYLRGSGATDAEKSTLEDDNALRAVTAMPQAREVERVTSGEEAVVGSFELSSALGPSGACSIDDPDCEACE